MLRLFPALLVAISLFGGLLVESTTAQERLPPKLDGQLLFHRYSGYDNFDSRVFLYDFSRNRLICLSEAWPIDHAMNAHFSPDGLWITFMGLPKGKREGKDWDVYRWRTGGTDPPENLTEGNGLRDEDPNFSPDGREIVIKQAGQIAILDPNSRRVRKIAIFGEAERSMPVFISGGRGIVAMENAAEDGDLFLYDSNGRNRKALAAQPGVQEYFPVPWDDKRLLYVRWHAADNRNDQIYIHDFSSKKNRPIPFCKPDANYSDSFPANERWLFFSTTAEPGAGGYDISLGDTFSGMIHELGVEGMNTPAEELGSSYLPHPK
jgi:Tol biopolymer transport system component